MSSGVSRELLSAVDAWRSERRVPKKAIPMLADAVIAQLSAGTAKHLAPHLPAELAGVPLANMTFLPIENAWFSGSMNYLGRARDADGAAQKDVAAVLRRDYLCSEERADKLSGAWGRHPLLGRMYLPAYRAGTEKVADLRRRHPAEKVRPALYGCRGLVDVVTIDRALAAAP